MTTPPQATLSVDGGMRAITCIPRHASRRSASIALTLGCWGLLGVVAAHAGSTQTPFPVRGVVRPVRQAVISTEAPLRAIELPLRESDRFRRGDVLAVFDCRRQKADLDAAMAVQREAAVTLDSNLQLDRFQAVGKNEVEIARARADKTRADIAGLESKMDECKFVAPFDGRITELAVRIYERTVPQRPFLSIIDDSQLEIEMIAPAANLLDLQPGTAFTFKIDELGGRIIDAKVDRLGAGVDPVSKTVKVIGSIVTQEPGILSGMSGTATIGLEMKP